MPIGFKLDPVQARRLHPRRRIGIIGDDAGNVPIFRRFGNGAMGWLAHRTGRDDRQPISGIPRRAPPQMGELDHHLAVMFMTIRHKRGQRCHNLILVGQQVAKGGRAVGGDQRRACRHGQRHAAARLFAVVKPIPLARHSAFGIGRLMRGRHDAVFQHQMFERIGL